MNRLTAHGMFDRREDRSILDADATVGNCDCWPAVCVSACELSGQLADAETDSDLDDAIEHFLSLLTIGLVDESQLRDVAWSVLATLEQWGKEVEPSAAWN